MCASFNYVPGRMEPLVTSQLQATSSPRFQNAKSMPISGLEVFAIAILKLVELVRRRAIYAGAVIRVPRDGVPGALLHAFAARHHSPPRVVLRREEAAPDRQGPPQ